MLTLSTSSEWVLPLQLRILLLFFLFIHPRRQPQRRVESFVLKVTLAVVNDRATLVDPVECRVLRLRVTFVSSPKRFCKIDSLLVMSACKLLVDFWMGPRDTSGRTW